jgi:deoxycytidylate deaminase
MTNKSYIGMSICFICLEPKEILLDKRLKNTLEQNMIVDMEPCDKCKKHIETGVILVNSIDGKQFNGTYAVVKDHVISNIFPEDRVKEIMKHRIAILETELYDKIIPKEKE